MVVNFTQCVCINRDQLPNSHHTLGINLIERRRGDTRPHCRQCFDKLGEFFLMKDVRRRPLVTPELPSEVASDTKYCMHI